MTWHKKKVEFEDIFLTFFGFVSINLTTSSEIAPAGIEDITFQTAIKSVCVPMIRNLFSGI